MMHNVKAFEIKEITEAEFKLSVGDIADARGGKYFKLSDGGEAVVCLSVRKNRFHARNAYIQPFFLKEEIDLKNIFSFLKAYFKSPLQCMLTDDDKRIKLLKRGGFKLVRRCFEREFTKDELKGLIPAENENIAEYVPANEEYGAACRLLYETYAMNHESINPLTAGLEEFCKDLPETVYCVKSGASNGFAFTEENEICYVGGNGNLKNFFAGVLDKIFSKYKSVMFEADDVDEVAMQLKNMFNDNCRGSFDTYIFN